MPREKVIQPAIVHGYQVPGEVRPKITGAESFVWYIEPDAQEQADKLAGHSVKLPYFFCGNPPEEGKRWPKHRRGGLAFVRNWLKQFAYVYDDVKVEAGGVQLEVAGNPDFDGSVRVSCHRHSEASR